MSKHLAVIVTVFLVALPVSVSAVSIDELKAQIQALMAQIAVLQSQQPSAASPGLPAPAPVTFRTVTPSAVSPQSANLGVQRVCPFLSRSLAFGYRGEDVRGLQQFLVDVGLLSADAATGYFGEQTRAAVRQWQAMRGIASSGDENTTGWGFVGLRSRAAIVNACQPTGVPDVTVVRPGTVPGCDALKFATSSVPNTQLGSAWTFPLMTATSTDNTLQFTVSGLPPGISMRESTTTYPVRTWLLSGTPTQGGEYTISIVAKNQCSTATRTIKVNIPGTSGSVCPARPLPSCYDWEKPMPLGNDVNGCGLGWYCGSKTVVCPVFQQPVCPAGQRLQAGSVLDNGCSAASTCVPESAMRISMTSPINAANRPYASSGNVITFSWTTTSAPSDSAVALYLLKREPDGATFTSQGIIAARKLPNDTFAWTVPANQSITCADCPTLQSVASGTYTVRAQLYTPSNAWLSGFPPANPVTATPVTAVDTGEFTIGPAI